MAKNSFTIFLALIWLIAANHCALADAFSPASSKNSLTHSSCCHHQDDSKKPFSKDPSRCSDTGCCQPCLTLKGEANLGIVKLLSSSNFIVPLFNLISESHAVGELLTELKLRINSPPIHEIELLSHSLSSSPNAPPFCFI